jgi:uncharacterized protein YjbI with pentapeptide repeats
MISRLHLWWKKIRQHPVAIGVVVASALAIALLVVFIGGYFFNWDWTGLSSYTPPVNVSNFQRGKTLWDWLQLLGVLAIPVVAGIGAAWFSSVQQQRDQRLTREQHTHDQNLAEQQANLEREITLDKQREEALQAYIDKMSELLLREHLSESTEKDDDARKMARARSLTLLRKLDAYRKRTVLQILYESRLIYKDNCIVDLNNADLRGANLRGIDLRRADLRGIDLRGTKLNGANLSEVILIKTNLSGAILNRVDLRGADLRETDLNGAKLHGAKLHGAKLSRAILNSVDLSGADLSEFDLSGTYLDGAKLSGAKLSRANLSEAKLSGAKLSRAILNSVDLTLQLHFKADQ